MSVEPGERGQPPAEELTDFPVPQEASVGLDLGKTSEGTFDAEDEGAETSAAPDDSEVGVGLTTSDDGSTFEPEEDSGSGH